MHSVHAQRGWNIPLIVMAAAAVLLAAQVMLMGGAFQSLGLGVPDLATQLGISAYAAKQLIDVFGSWYFTILIVALTGGWGAGLVAIAKSLAARYGAKYAAAW